jgi:hypothetical protein
MAGKLHLAAWLMSVTASIVAAPTEISVSIINTHTHTHTRRETSQYAQIDNIPESAEEESMYAIGFFFISH